MGQPTISKPVVENWENEGGSVSGPLDAPSLGITRFLTETYVVGGYTYTNLADAIAQGQRMHKQGAAL